MRKKFKFDAHQHMLLKILQYYLLLFLKLRNRAGFWPKIFGKQWHFRFKTLSDPLPDVIFLSNRIYGILYWVWSFNNNVFVYSLFSQQTKLFSHDAHYLSWIITSSWPWRIWKMSSLSYFRPISDFLTLNLNQIWIFLLSDMFSPSIVSILL